jgi:hypothetical protein
VEKEEAICKTYCRIQKSRREEKEELEEEGCEYEGLDNKE